MNADGTFSTWKEFITYLLDGGVAESNGANAVFCTEDSEWGPFTFILKDGTREQFNLENWSPFDWSPRATPVMRKMTDREINVARAMNPHRIERVRNQPKEGWTENACGFFDPRIFKHFEFALVDPATGTVGPWQEYTTDKPMPKEE